MERGALPRDNAASVTTNFSCSVPHTHTHTALPDDRIHTIAPRRRNL